MEGITYVKCAKCLGDTPEGMFCGSCGARLDGLAIALSPIEEDGVVNAPFDAAQGDIVDDGGAGSEVLADAQTDIPMQYNDPLLRESAEKIRTLNGNGKKHEKEEPIDDTPFGPIIADLLQQREELALKESDLVDFEKELAGKSEELKLHADLFSQREVQLAERESVVAECERGVQNSEAGHWAWIEATEKDLRERNAELDEREGRLVRREEDLNKSEQANRNRVEVIGKREALALETETKQLSRAESIAEMEKMISDRTNALNQREADLDARESAFGKHEAAAKKVAKSENVQVLISVLLGLSVVVGAIFFMVWMSKQ